MSKKIEEYKQLYAEIHSNADKVAFALGIIYSGTSGIITYGLSNYKEVNSFVFLAPFFLLIPLTFFINSQLNSTARIAAYLKVFHEDIDEGLFWEHRLSKFKTPEKLRNSKYARSLISILFGLSTVCILLTFINLYPGEGSYFRNLNTFTILFSTVLFLILLFGLYGVKKAKTIDYKQHYVDKFLEIKVSEKTHNK